MTCRPTAELIEHWRKLLESRTATRKQMAKHFGVSTTSTIRWMRSGAPRGNRNACKAKPSAAELDRYRAQLATRQISRAQLAAILEVSEGTTYKWVPAIHDTSLRGNRSERKPVPPLPVMPKPVPPLPVMPKPVDRGAAIRKRENEKRAALQAQIQEILRC